MNFKHIIDKNRLSKYNRMIKEALTRSHDHLFYSADDDYHQVVAKGMIDGRKAGREQKGRGFLPR